MNNCITEPPYKIALADGGLSGKNLVKSSKNLGDIKNLFEDQEACQQMDGKQVVYEVEALFPVEDGSKGGLFFGRTIISPGKVGNEYFMTKGHFHRKEDRSEFYWGIKGEGILLFMNRQREVWAESMFPGSLHYIDSFLAHRTINTGFEPLIFEACWPSDAGHNYDEIIEAGFSGRIKEIQGEPQLVTS